MINEILDDADSRMGKSIESFKSEMSKVRTGRAHPSLLQHIMVPYYGSDVPLNQVANVSIGDSRTLNVTPFEKTMVQAVEKAIISSNLGLMPTTAGSVMRVPLPPLTEERRRDMTKIVRAEAESARVAIRNIRRDAISDFKELQKEKEITEDELHKAEDSVQKLTDKHVKAVDALLEVKEADLMQV